MKSGLVVVLLLTGTGCRDEPTDDWDPIIVGVSTEVGQVEVREILIVSRGESHPGRFLGTLFNESDEDVEVTLISRNDEVTVTVPASGTFPFDTNPVILDSVSEIPGSRVPIIIESGGEESDELAVPLVDGTLEPYRDYLPTEGLPSWGRSSDQ